MNNFVLYLRNLWDDIRVRLRQSRNCEIHASRCGTKIRLWILLSSSVIVIRGSVRRYVCAVYDDYSWRNKPLVIEYCWGYLWKTASHCPAAGEFLAEEVYLENNCDCLKSLDNLTFPIPIDFVDFFNDLKLFFVTIANLKSLVRYERWERRKRKSR